MEQLDFLEKVQWVQCGNCKMEHWLKRKASGYIQMRVTIDRGTRFVGKRITIGLQTKDPYEAMIRRDVALEALKHAEYVSQETEKQIEKILGRKSA